MTTRRRLLVTVLSIVVLVSALALPFSASAGRWLHERGKMRVPRNATEPSYLEVAGISVTVYPESLPRGGPVILGVFTGPQGQFRAQFSPDRQFDAPVMMDFGTVTEVVYEGPQGDVVIVTQDLDGDGEVGEIMIDHFSRYSGW